MLATEPGFVDRRLEQLDRVAARVLDQDLLAADALDDVVAKARPVLAQVGDDRLEVGDLELKAVPPAGRRQRAVGHRLAAAGSAAGRGQDQPQVAVREHRERGRRMHDLVEAELAAVEVDRGVDVVDDVADADCGHGGPPRSLAAACI